MTQMWGEAQPNRRPKQGRVCVLRAVFHPLSLRAGQDPIPATDDELVSHLSINAFAHLRRALPPLRQAHSQPPKPDGAPAFDHECVHFVPWFRSAVWAMGTLCLKI